MTYIKDSIEFLPKPTNTRFIDLSDRVFGKLTVLGLVRRIQDNRPAWLCECKCGKLANPLASELTRGRTTSCGCSRYKSHNKTHGMFHSPTYHIWMTMKARCNNPNAVNYKDYGGRGIKVCERWNEFTNFLADMGERPSRLTLERRDNKQGYLPKNCYWATPVIQNNNKRNNHLLTLNDKTQSMKLWCNELHLSYSLIRTRVNTLGWSDEKALTTPSRRSTKQPQLLLPQN